MTARTFVAVAASVAIGATALACGGARYRPAIESPGQAPNRALAREHVTWGIKLAQARLWEDATTQFQRAVDADPMYAEAWNDLAVGYEQLGRLADARDAYDKALELGYGNQFIRNNNDEFRQIYDRQNIRGSGS